MGALIGNDRFQVHHVSHDRIFASNAHGTQYLSGLPGDAQGDLYIIALAMEI